MLVSALQSTLVDSVGDTIRAYYRISISFKNYIIYTNTTKYVLDGVINGVLQVDYHFINGNVSVYTRYVEYTLTGFKNPLSRRYISSIIEKGSMRVYSRFEKPLESSESFIMSGSLKYYVYPGNLPLDPWIRQRIKFYYPLKKTTMMIYEDRYFKYMSDKGILVEAEINAEIYVDNSTQSYMLKISLIPGGNLEYWLSHTSSILMILLASVTITLGSIIYAIRVKRF